MTWLTTLKGLPFNSKLLWNIIWCIAIALSIFALKSIFTGPLEPWDAFWNWIASTRIAQGNFEPEQISGIPIHHILQWGVSIPTAIFIKIFGETVTTYYLVPLVVSTTLTIFLFYIGKRQFAFPVLVLLLMLLLVDPMIMRYSTQLHTNMFAALYGLIAIMCIERASWQRIVTAALFVFLSYGAKETNGVIFGFTALALIFFRFGTKPTLLFIASFALFLVIETITINHSFDFKDITLGRLELLSESYHIQNMAFEQTTATQTHFYKSWFGASIFYKLMAAATFLFGGILLFNKKIISSTPSIITSCTLATCIFNILTLVPFQSPAFKHYATILPFLFMTTCYLINKVYLSLRDSYKPLISLSIVIFSFATATNAYFVSPVLGVKGLKDERLTYFSPNYFRLMPNAYFWNAEDHLAQVGFFIIKGYGVSAREIPAKAVHYWLTKSEPIEENPINLKIEHFDDKAFIVSRAAKKIYSNTECLMLEYHTLFTPIRPVNCMDYVKPTQNRKGRK